MIADFGLHVVAVTRPGRFLRLAWTWSDIITDDEAGEKPLVHLVWRSFLLASAPKEDVGGLCFDASSPHPFGFLTLKNSIDQVIFVFPSAI